MNTVASINTYLHRPLKSGKQYNKYFSKTPCKTTFLTEGTTTEGLQQMVSWVNQHKHQTEKLAKKLQGATVKETVTNIYEFLYHHIQYSADGFNQNLRSPKCSWQTRKKGVECKSYSVFASSILSNLQIKHSFRKVKQPSSPQIWSHVYVVVFHNNKELIIDATKAENTEVQYVDKEDMKVVERSLPYYGLNASLPAKNNTATAQVLANFKAFLHTKGIDKSTIIKIYNSAVRSVNKGIDPAIEITPTFIKVGAEAFSLGYGLNWVETATSILGSLGSLGSLFGPEDRASVLAKADILVKGEIDKAITIFNSQGKAAAISFLDGKISHNRSLARKYTSGNSIAKHTKMAKDLETFKNSLQAGNITSSNQPVNNPTPFNPNNSNNNLDVNGLIQLASGLFQDPQTGQTFTPQQVQATNSVTNPNTSKDKGMSTTTMVAVGVGVLAVGAGAYVYMNKKK